jgi:hypothetical protein
MTAVRPRTAADAGEMLEKTGTTVYGLYQDFVPGDVAKFQRQNQKDKKGCSGGTVEEFGAQTGGAILIGTPEESDELLIKQADSFRPTIARIIRHRAKAITASLRSLSRLAMPVQTASAFRLRPSGR